MAWVAGEPTAVRTRILEAGAPVGLGEAVLAGLPPPFQGGRVEQASLDLTPCRDALRDQVDASCLLQRLPAPQAGWVVLLLTGVDLFLPVLTYVFGASQLGAGKSVLSSARLHLAGPDAGAAPTPPGRAALGERNLLPRLLVRRALVESLHELGHAMGLTHCVVPDCAMHRSLWPEAIDLKAAAYCPSCRAVLARAPD